MSIIRSTAFVTMVTSAALLTVAGPAHAQTSDDHGVRIITQDAAAIGNVTAGDEPGFPVTITEAGSYRLGSNLVVPDGNTTAVDITAPSVALDLNGFSILGPGVAGTGVGIRASNLAITASVRNGMVRGMGSTGISLHRSCRVEGMQVTGNGAGIVANVGCSVTNNVVNVNRGVGIRALGGTVIGNTLTANSGLGLELGVANPAPNEVGINVGYVNNLLTDNNGGNANPQVTGGVQMGLNVCGTKPCR